MLGSRCRAWSSGARLAEMLWAVGMIQRDSSQLLSQCCVTNFARYLGVPFVISPLQKNQRLRSEMLVVINGSQEVFLF